jgi:hypothetical protein
MGRFAATCETCLATVSLTEREQWEQIGADGEFQCEMCLSKPPAEPGPRRSPRNYPRDTGCIVTTMDADGDVRVEHRGGEVYAALREITGRLSAGAVVLSISTPRTILRDITGGPRAYGNSTRQVDPHIVERVLLGKLGRLDLMPPNALRGKR